MAISDRKISLQFILGLSLNIKYTLGLAKATALVLPM
jgi:hypothetical protein